MGTASWKISTSYTVSNWPPSPDGETLKYFGNLRENYSFQHLFEVKEHILFRNVKKNTQKQSNKKEKHKSHK